MTSTLVFDFDGTVAVGTGPVIAYAEEIARHTGEGFLDSVQKTLEAFERGEEPGYRDGYDVVARFAAEAGVDAAAAQAAYASSRAVLGTARAQVDVAPGLPALLAQLPETTRVVLATNAPELGVERVLEAWGVRERFDQLRYDLGKPGGLGPVIEEYIAHGPVLSIGDMVENDLAPAAALGADTALVGATAAASVASVTMRAATLADLAPQIIAWARSADASSPVSPGTVRS